MEEVARTTTRSVVVRGDTFTVFPKLPAELRLKIFKLSIPTDRIVAITDQRVKVYELSGGSQFQVAISARYTIPALMHTNRESRNETMKLYTFILKHQLGDPIPFNFEHDTLLMDGPDGTVTLWSFEKSARMSTEAWEELLIIHANLKHLAIHGQRIITRCLNEVQQYTNLETLILPQNPYWNCPDGPDAFDQRIAERLRLEWTHWKEEEPVEIESREDGEDTGASVEGYDGVRFGLKRFKNLKLGVPRAFPEFTHYLDLILGDGRDYSKIDCGTQIVFLDEHDLKHRLAYGTKVILSYIDGPNHPAFKARKKDMLYQDSRSEVNTPQSFSAAFQSMSVTPAQRNDAVDTWITQAEASRVDFAPQESVGLLVPPISTVVRPPRNPFLRPPPGSRGIIYLRADAFDAMLSHVRSVPHPGALPPNQPSY